MSLTGITKVAAVFIVPSHQPWLQETYSESGIKNKPMLLTSSLSGSGGLQGRVPTEVPTVDGFLHRGLPQQHSMAVCWPHCVCV